MRRSTRSKPKILNNIKPLAKYNNTTSNQSSKGQSSDSQTVQGSNPKRCKTKVSNVEKLVPNIEELEENVDVVKPETVFSEKYDDQPVLNKDNEDDNFLFKNPDPNMVKHVLRYVSLNDRAEQYQEINESDDITQDSTQRYQKFATSEMLATLVNKTKIMFLRVCDPPFSAYITLAKMVAPGFVET
ncbi:5257_t:CDS:2, partial [Funneliformis caledonium]